MGREERARRTAFGAALGFLLGSAPVAADAQEGWAIDDPGAAETRYADRTFRFASEEHGSGIIYADERGRAFLWMPGQIRIVRGLWELEPVLLERSSGVVSNRMMICLEFFGNRSGPSGIARFKAKDCLPADRFDEMVLEWREGDLLGLATGAVPCRLCDPAMAIGRLGGS